MAELFPTLSSQRVRHNLLEAELVEYAVRRGEGKLAASGAFVVETGQHTGRSVQDKYIVRDAETEGAIWWDNALSMTDEQFDRLLADFIGFARHKEIFVQDLFAGAEKEHRLNTRVITEHAWQSLFIRNLLRRPERSELASFVPEFTVVDLPSFRAAPLYHGTRSETVIACNFSKRIVLIGGTSYAGEIKKSVFSFLNYILPGKNVMPMHCSANVGKDGSSAVFFGLSGTGKTTLSADPTRELLGDDEHGWSDRGIFNFEGGCYAKTIRLSKSAEPQIWDASNRFGTVLENVVIDPVTRIPNFDDNRLAENSRSAYP
ncbi:MAG: phosphoenolpyruvate carboxykinase (ATP), partial [Proteobacteria bacterium]|nr:phosphoenolpyruvate carboxykinase (ATP) [Pseudomonadota bacterium]